MKHKQNKFYLLLTHHIELASQDLCQLNIKEKLAENWNYLVEKIEFTLNCLIEK